MDAIREERRKSARWRLPQAFGPTPPLPSPRSPPARSPPARSPPGDVSSESEDASGAESESDEDAQIASVNCEDDRCRGPVLPIWHCVDCDSSYCSDCWPLQGPHKPKKKGRDGVPHEKTNPNVVRRLKGILNPTRSADAITRMHEEDESTKWFGVSRDATGRPSFEDYGRYATLMATISDVDGLANRYPQLVSFIGVTNAGKSTLIKMLINHEGEGRNAEQEAIFPSPVVGSAVNDALPTSGDVHLYADPATHAEQLPLMYADCEGFEGGEQTPLGARSRLKGGPDAMKDNDNVLTRPIEWANDDVSRQREFAVTALYPRLLYTFSDCVVFVLRNPKTFQSSVLTKLLEWGVAALEKSINQPALPHCVVAVNGTDPSVKEDEWDVGYATQSLLTSVSGALDEHEGVPRFRELADYWRGLGKDIFTVEDLILHYYSSFKVVRIPAKPRYMTINEQIGKLHGVIRSNCEQSFRTKRRARMLTNADELNNYLQSGFDHFTTHLNVPFNFMQVSLLRNPIPNDFGGHILQLCTTISSQQPRQAGRANWLFEQLSVMLASCVLLDCARFRKGRVDELFGNYEKFFDYALGEFTEVHWPCEYVEPISGRRCQLVKARHLTKGHQDERGIIAAGDYQAAFDTSFLPEWKLQLRAAIGDIQRDFSYELEQASYDDDVQAIPEERIALDLHIEYLNQFFESVGPAAAICSHATCFSCLMDVPEHPLQCGHVLCSACVKAYGKPNKSSLIMACCPLHREATKWAKPTVIRFKPPTAGVRVLALDGGGVRGIVQLEVLRAIEKALGAFLPIQSFFDLIIGSGTGGLLAAALQTQDRTVDSCIDMFNALCDHAFMPRLRGVPILNNLAAAIGSGPKYKTKPLHQALKTAFSEEEDLFGASTKLRPGARVAMTSTSVTGRESILLASYRRPEDSKPAYKFERPNEPEMELKLWQAVAGSMATPTYFKPLTFHGQIYQDGGLRCTNPSFIADHERRLIWPDVAEPDLFLSLGTGQNRISVLSKMPGKAQSSAAIEQPAAKGNRSGWWRSRRVDDIVDAEVSWAEFRTQTAQDKNETKRRRYVRFNPDLDKEPCAQDSKGEIENLQVSVRKRLQTPHRLAALRNVAHRLVATAFYLELQSKGTAEKTEQICSTVISCRYEDGSEEMRALGQVLELRRTDDFDPYLLIKPDVDSLDSAFKVPFSKELCQAMIKNGVFGLANIYIPLKDETKQSSITLFLTAHDGLEPDGFPISGFPRTLLGETAAAAVRRVKQMNAEPMRPNTPMSTLTIRTVTPVDDDAISLNGRGGNLAHQPSFADMPRWSTQPTVLKPPSTSSSSGTTIRPSLADILAQQNPSAGTSIRGRTNRFWTYIGNTHMAQHPEMYTAEELAKFAANSEVNVKDLVAPRLNGQTSPATLSGGLPSPIEPVEETRPESDDSEKTAFHTSSPPTALPQLQQQQYKQSKQRSSTASIDKVYQANEKLRGLTIDPGRYQAPRPGYLSGSTASNANSNSPATPGFYEDARETQQQQSQPQPKISEDSGDETNSAYSGHEEIAQASPVVQLPSPTFPLHHHHRPRPQPPIPPRDHLHVSHGSPIENDVASSLRPKSSTVRDLELWLSAQKQKQKKKKSAVQDGKKARRGSRSPSQPSRSLVQEQRDTAAVVAGFASEVERRLASPPRSGFRSASPGFRVGGGKGATGRGSGGLGAVREDLGE